MLLEIDYLLPHCVLRLQYVYGHFMENVWIWRMYVYYDTYPLSAYEKWIGADNASVQPLLLYLIMPALCAIPYGRSFYFDVKSGYAAQIISRGKKSDYIRAKYGSCICKRCAYWNDTTGV